MIRARFLALFLAASCIAGAAGEFDAVVKAVETHFGVTRTHIPLMGVANFALKVARPAGTSGFRIALFQDFSIPDDRQDELDSFMTRLTSDRLHPLIRTRSRPNAEATYIFMGEAGKTTQLLVATFGSHEATVVEVKVNFDTLMRWIESPELAGKSLHSDRDW